MLLPASGLVNSYSSWEVISTKEARHFENPTYFVHLEIDGGKADILEDFYKKIDIVGISAM